MKILGLTSFIHSSSAAMLADGEVVAAADEERFSRVKFTGQFPRHAVKFCLDQGGMSLGDVDWLAFYWNPRRAILQRTCMMAGYLPHSLAFLKKKAAGEAAIRGDFQSWWNMVNVSRVTRRAFPGGESRFHRRFVDHHLAHAASAYYVSPWEEALILSLDGTGEWTTTLMAKGTGRNIRKIREIAYPHSLGVLYGAITQFLGYQIYQDEWKVMGLAAYGSPRQAEKVRRLIHCRNGRFRLNLEYFNFQYADKGLWFGPRFVELFGPPRGADEPVDSERFADLAASFQLVTEETGLFLVRHLLQAGGGCQKLCIAGGVGLNAVLNGKILAETDVAEIFVQPAAGDSGAALGAALYLHHEVLNGRRSPPMRNAYLGPEYDEPRILAALQSRGLSAVKHQDIESRAAALLTEGKILGWFQGRMEYGPRALGNRSILADPRRRQMKEILNAKVKFREGFRPFAPAILAERVGEYFEQRGLFPFMTVVLPIKPGKRALIPAVVHHDGTGRLQAVEKEVNPRFYGLIREFDRLTGVPVVLNTSFNLQGEPIVCTPEDAVATFLRSGLDALILGNYLCVKTET